MLFRLLPLLGRAIIIAAVAVALWWVYSLLQRPAAPETATTIQTGPVVLEQIRRVNKQIFIEQYLTVDVRYEETPASWFDVYRQLGIKQGFVMLLRGTVPAGVDLKQMREDAIWVSADGRRVQLALPPPRIFEENLSIDRQNSILLAEQDNCPDFLCPESNLQTYWSTIEPEAVDKLQAAALEAGILDQAAEEAREYYENLLYKLGFDEVRVIVQGY